MTTAYPRTLRKGHWFDGALLQLPVLLIVGNLLLPIVWFSGKVSILTSPLVLNTISASMIATAFTWYSLEKLRYFANTRRLSYVIPVNFATFGILYGMLGLLRLPYSNTIALLNLFAVVALTFLITALTRKSSVHQWIIPGGEVDQVTSEHARYSLATFEDIQRLTADPPPYSALVVDLHHSHSPEWGALIAQAAINGLPVYHYRQIMELETGQVRIDHLRENNFGSLIPNLGFMGFKRVIDIIGVFVVLLFLVPLFLVLAILIKLDSPGPILFKQSRVGFRGKTFQMYKLRSMRSQSDMFEAQEYVMDQIDRKHGQRITRFGSFMRRTRLDELPQVVNILKGEMSWIGPRPEEERLSQLYEVEIPFYRYRHIVRPGITGWAQVNQGHVAEVNEVTKKLRYDFYYVRNISLWLDALILMKTVRIIFGGFGAK